MRCDGTPDPAVQQDINTYISLWRDDPEVDITLVLKQCDLALQVCVCVMCVPIKSLLVTASQPKIVG